MHAQKLGFCVCGHGRADHSSDNYDLDGHLGACLVCNCEVFCGSLTETKAQISAEALRNAKADGRI
jgi:hypothetical protein